MTEPPVFSLKYKVLDSLGEAWVVSWRRSPTTIQAPRAWQASAEDIYFNSSMEVVQAENSDVSPSFCNPITVQVKYSVHDFRPFRFTSLYRIVGSYIPGSWFPLDDRAELIDETSPVVTKPDGFQHHFTTISNSKING